MQIKRSANAGEPLERLLVSENAQHEQLAFDLNLSSQMVSHMKTNRRKMQQDIAKESIRLYDNPEYIMDILHSFSDGFTSPVMRGKQVEQHRLALRHTTAKEMRNVLNMMESAGLEKNIESLSTVEREQIAIFMDDLVDRRLLSDNLLKQLQVEYRLSLKARIKDVLIKWKALGWI